MFLKIPNRVLAYKITLVKKMLNALDTTALNNLSEDDKLDLMLGLNLTEKEVRKLKPI